MRPGKLLLLLFELSVRSTLQVGLTFTFSFTVPSLWVWERPCQGQPRHLERQAVALTAQEHRPKGSYLEVYG